LIAPSPVRLMYSWNTKNTIAAAGRRRSDGLVAGQERFSAAADERGHGYLAGCSLRRG
jgi:hypothetical protein